jgi:hypothetical protein
MYALKETFGVLPMIFTHFIIRYSEASEGTKRGCFVKIMEYLTIKTPKKLSLS